jgi:signal transduction histidine kinase
MVSQEGTGLGLFLTQALAHMHGGQLAIESTLGEGTQVTVTLPPGRVVTPAT